MARPIVKYLDPISGEYEFATVVDVGDLRDLNTTIKSDIVGAINSIISDGVHNPINNEKIEDLERIINSLKDGTFEIDDFGSIDEYLKQQFLEELDKINEKNREEIQSVLTQLDTSVDDAIRDYQEKVAAQNIILENAENTLADARDTLEAKAAELETANIGLSELETEFNELDNYISTNVRTIDFDNFNAMVEDYETVVTQTSDEVGVDMSGSTLSYLTGRVSDAEANISAQADEITSKMSYDEFQYMPVPKYSYGENLLFDTFDFGDAWSGKNGAQVTTDTFLFGKVVAFNSPTGLYETLTDDLTVGESYVLSTYVNVQPSEKSPSQGKYEPVSKSYDPTDFKVQIGGKSFNPGVYEDLSGINGWVRINQEFVADAVNPIISITPVGVNSQDEVAYMAMPKIEKGLTVTPWQPHVEDNYATISSTQSMIKQQANSITAFVTEVSELDDSYKQATSTFQMLADGFAANTEAVEAYEDAVTRYGTEYSNINGKFEQKVWKDDFDAIIEDINIDNRNRVLNSDFIRSEISSSDRRLIVEDWSLNSDWELKTIDNDEYLSRNRTGLVQNLITSASSNYFPVRDGERILFGFDLIHSGLDNDKVFAIELFDISNRRLLKQEFSLSSLTKVGNRYHGSFNISTPGAEKGSVVLQLPKNGSVSFTKISFQNADIGSVDWSPAPEDSWIIQSKLATYISQVEDEITIGGTGQKIDTLTGLLTEDKGTFTLNPDKIATEVFNSETYDDMGFVNKTNFEQTADGWMQEITSKGRLAGYINASPDTYRISFDKIMLEGTTWADALGSSKITVTENFALLGKNGRPVLDVNNDGSINMNVTSLKIGQYNALTTDDKSDIESEVADKVIKTTEPYIHIAYADTEDGAGLSFNPSGKKYIGFYKSHLPTPSGTPSNYTWSKYVGDAGKDGVVGKDGVGLIGTNINYATSTSGTIRPNSWGDEVPTTQPGDYLWTKTTWYYSDNTSENGYSVSRIGKDGNTGKDGLAGKDGVGITKTTITYAKSSSGTTAPTTGYTTTVPSANPGEFVWTKTVWMYTDNTSETGYSVGKIGNTGATGATGKDGVAGKDGVGIRKTEIHYASSTSGTTKPSTGWNLTVPTISPGNYLWTKTTWTYTDGTIEEGYSVSRIGKDGNTGKDGIAGKDGVGIKSTVIDYATSSSGTTKPTSGWTSTVPSVTPGNYLWTRTVWTYTDNDVETGYSVSRIGKDGEQGPRGPQGIQGPSGSNGQSQWVHIRYSANSNGSSMTPNPSSSTKYVGIAVTNSATAPAYTGFTWSKYVGEDGSRGPQGLPGQKGTDGTTTYTWVRYADTPTSGMNNFPDGKKYIGMAFNKTTQTESNNYSDYQWSLMPQNIEVGGRNYAKGTSNEFTYANVGTYSGSLTSGGTTSQNVYTLEELGAQAGDIMTVSMYVGESKEGYGGGFRIDDQSGQNKYSTYKVVKNEYVSETFTILEGSTEIRLYTTGYGQSGASAGFDLPVKELKLEKGNTATDWTEAPEDTQAKIDDIGNGIGDLYLADKTGVLSGQEIFTDKADEGGLVHVEVDGKSIGGGSGKNLAIGNYSEWHGASSGGVWWRHLSSELNQVPLDKLGLKIGGKLTYSFDIKTTDSEAWARANFFNSSGGYTASTGNKVNGEGRTTVTFTIPQDTVSISFGFDFADAGSKTTSIEYRRVQIEKNDRESSYEPPAPSPDYPIEIHSLNDFDVVSSIGKRNIIKNSTKYDYSTTATTMHTNIMPDLKEELVVGQDYTFSFEVKSDTPTSSSRVFINSTTLITKNIAFNTNWTRHYVTFTYDGGYYASRDRQIHPHIYPSGSGMKYIRNIKLEKGRTDTGWTPAPEDLSESSNHPLIDKINLLLDNPLRRVGNVKDRLFRDSDGLWKVRRKIVSEKLSNLTFASTDPTGGNSYLFDDSVAFICTLKEHISTDVSTWGNKIISSHFREVQGNNYNWNKNGGNAMPEQIGTVHQISGTEYYRIFFRVPNSTIGATMNDSLSTLNSKMTKWVRENNIDLQYHARNESVEVLPMSVQDKLNSLSSFAKSNYVYTIDDNDVNPNLNVVFKSKGWKHKLATDKLESDIINKADTQEVESEFNDVASELQVLHQELEAAASANELSNFIDQYNKDMESRDSDKRESEENISKALSSVSLIENNMKDMSETWTFIDRFIKNTPEGIVVGNESTGSYILMKEDRISFYSNGQEVAFISQNLMEISRGAFVEEIQVAKYKFEESTNNHLTIRYVG